MRTLRELFSCAGGRTMGFYAGSMTGRKNGGGSGCRLPWDATKQGPVLKAEGPSPARRIAESSCRLRTTSGGEGPNRRVGSEGLATWRDMERPGAASAIRECSYVLLSGFHQGAYWIGTIALVLASSLANDRTRASFSAPNIARRDPRKNLRVVRGGVR